MSKGFLGGRANQVLAATGLTFVALQGGLEVTDNTHGWRVSGDYLPFAGEETSSDTSHYVEQYEEDSYLEPATVSESEAEQSCVIPATDVTKIEFTTDFKDWTLPYGMPFLLGGTLLFLAMDNKQRYGKVFPEHTRPALAYVGILTGSAALGGLIMYGCMSNQMPTYTYDTPSETSDAAVSTTAQVLGTEPETAPSYSYPTYEYVEDNCADADREIVRVTDEKTVTYRDGRLDSDGS